MNKTIKAAALAAAATLAIVGTAPAAEAHDTCQGAWANTPGPCNTIQNIGYVGIGILNYSVDAGYRWILPGNFARTDGWPLYQADVGGFYIGSGYCAQVGGSWDNVNFSWKTVGRGTYKTDWLPFNKVNAFPC